MNKTIPLISLTVIVVAIIVSLECMAPTRLLVKNVINDILLQSVTVTSSTSTKKLPKVFTKQELTKYKGENDGKVYLAILGSVFDVSKGRRHYGPGGGYDFFAGIDGSKAFVTGKFEGEGLTDDVSKLGKADHLSLHGWKEFYEKDYSYIGVLEGFFYNANGEETFNMQQHKHNVEIAVKEKELLENSKKLFPPCNTEWSQQHGSRVWCSKLSGGIQRDWVGVPRMYYSPGKATPRCACVRTIGPPSHDLDNDSHKNGDLDNPNLKPYPGCDVLSESCTLYD